MSVLSLRTNFPGQNYQDVRLCRLSSTDALSTVAGAGYLDAYLKMNSVALYTTDFVHAACSNGNQIYKPVFSAGGSCQLTVLP